MARNRTVTERSGLALDTRSYKDAAKALRQGARHLQKDFRSRLREGGEIMAAEARKIAAEHSESIPSTVKVRVAGATVAVTAGGPKSPVASLYELGNVGGRKSAAASNRGTFRHPVFGTDVWVEQPRYPFLKPAADATLPAAQAAIVRALDDAAHIIATEYYRENY